MPPITHRGGVLARYEFVHPFMRKPTDELDAFLALFVIRHRSLDDPRKIQNASSASTPSP